jgi:hypothetical protein
VVDEHGQFREDNFSTAMAVLQNAGDAAKVEGALAPVMRIRDVYP